MMRPVPIANVRGAGLSLLAGAGLWVSAGCGVLGDDVRYDTRAEERPGTWVSRLETEIGGLQRAYDDMIVKATPAERRRLPSIGSELSRLADAAHAMSDDLSWKRGRFGEHLERAEAVATSIEQQLGGAPVTADVRSRWWNTAYALGFVRESYRTLGTERLYEVENDPRGVVTLARDAPKEDYDASFEVDQVRRGYDRMVKAWRDAPARRTGAPWTAELERELGALSDPVKALGRVDAGARAAVTPAAQRVRQQAERVRPLVEARETELPPALIEGWQQLSGWVGRLGEP